MLRERQTKRKQKMTTKPIDNKKERTELHKERSSESKEENTLPPTENNSMKPTQTLRLTTRTTSNLSKSEKTL